MQKITFAEEVKPSTLNQQQQDNSESSIDMSNRKLSSGSSDENRSSRRFSTHSSIPEDAILDDRDHKQDWSKSVSDRDTWAHQERRRLSGWSNTDVATAKQMAGRRGSVLSMWAPGKDAQGNDVLLHNDEHGGVDAVVDAEPSSRNSDILVPSSPPSINGKNSGSLDIRRASNNSSDAGRRGSILSMWKGSKDKHGNDIIGHDDEEWAR